MDTDTDLPVTQGSVTLFSRAQPLTLERGGTLGPITVAYETYGELNSRGDNVALVCHALTGSAHAAGVSPSNPQDIGWWDPLIGPGRGLDTRELFVVCSNFLGGCYGTTGCTSINPATGKRYGLRFPLVTVRDMVTVQKALLKTLGVKRLRTVIGGSLGGMQVLEWAALFPEFVDSIIPIGTAAQHSPWCISLNDLARQAIMNDPAWNNGEYNPDEQPRRGLSLARQIAMISYRSDTSFLKRFARDLTSPLDGTLTLPRSLETVFQVESYLHYQGEKLVRRFDANTYLSITRTMDMHDVGRDRGAVRDVLGGITVPALCIGISSDVLYPVHEQRAIAAALGRGKYAEITSPHGHDAFLIEYPQLNGMVKEFLKAEAAR